MTAAARPNLPPNSKRTFASNRLPDIAALRALFAPSPDSVPAVEVQLAELSSYDQLLAERSHGGGCSMTRPNIDAARLTLALNELRSASHQGALATLRRTGRQGGLARRAPARASGGA